MIATDGFNEARDPDGELFGTERLLAAVDSVHGESAGDIGKHLSEAVRDFQRGREQDDDQTLLVMKGARPGVTPCQACVRLDLPADVQYMRVVSACVTELLAARAA